MNPRQLLSRVWDIAEFHALQKKFASIQGWLDDVEGYALLLLAAEGPGVGAIVEIGSYMGRSTAFLAAGAKRAGRERVTAVDHFKGSPEHQAGKSVESKVLLAEGTTLHRFQKNMVRMGLEDYVNTIVGTSEEAVRNWTDPVRLLFIDADHSYAASKGDFELWSPFVVPQGVVCFHDINHWPGVTQFYRELMGSTTDYREIATVRSTKVIQRRARPSKQEKLGNAS
ncbi:MAG: class I SAM-dependent methyltransferase [Planctomycetes bacterium]|nr:class I SAM-dependent methyltransferase [Planctomycetota bacterium]